MRSPIAAVLAVIAVLSLSSAPASAGGVEAGTEGEEIVADVWVDDASRPGGGSTRRCRFVPAAMTIAGGAGKEVLIGGVPHVLYSRHCDGERLGTVWLANVTPDDVLRYAHQEVRRKVPSPEPVLIWPDPDYDWAYTQVPLDFRATPGDWAPVEATATAANAVETISVTVRATPSTLTLISGDPGGPADASCGGESPLAAYEPAAPGACSYTYINASSAARNGRTFTAALQIIWTLDYWSTTNPGFAGTLPALTTETTFPIEVAEVKALAAP